MAFKVPKWDENNTNSIEPAVGLQTDGFEANDALPAATFNWLHRQNGLNWAVIKELFPLLIKSGVQVHPSTYKSSSADTRAPGPTCPTLFDDLWIVSSGVVPAGTGEELTISRVPLGHNLPDPLTPSLGLGRGQDLQSTLSGYSILLSAQSVCGHSGPHSGAADDDDRLFAMSTSKDLSVSNRVLSVVTDRSTRLSTVSFGPPWATSTNISGNRVGYNRFTRTAYIQNAASTVRAYPLGAADYNITLPSLTPGGGRANGNPLGVLFYELVSTSGELETSFFPDSDPSTPVNNLTGSNLGGLVDAETASTPASRRARITWDDVNACWWAVVSAGESDSTLTTFLLRNDSPTTPHTGWVLERQLFQYSSDPTIVDGFTLTPNLSSSDLICVNGTLYSYTVHGNILDVGAIVQGEYAKLASLSVRSDPSVSAYANVATTPMGFVVCGGSLYVTANSLVKIPIL